MAIHQSWLKTSGLLLGLTIAALIAVLVGGRNVPTNVANGRPGSDASKPEDTPAFAFEVMQSEPGRDGSPVVTGWWQVAGQGGDFDATLQVDGKTQWIAKRKDAFFHSRGTAFYRFQADTWAKGYLDVPSWGRFDAELPGFPIDIGEGPRPVDSMVQTAAVLHVLTDLDQSANLGADADGEVDEVAVVGGEACCQVRVVPAAQEQGDADWRPLGFAPEVTCRFAESDGRLVAMDIAVSRLNSQGKGQPWIGVSTVVSQWGSAGGARVPAEIRSEIRDLQTGQSAAFTNVVLFGIPPKASLAQIPVDAATAIDLDPRAPSVYQQRIAQNPTDWAAHLALVRHQAFGAKDADGAKQQLAKLAVGLEAAPAAILTQAAELAYVLGADETCVQCVDRAMNANNKTAIDDSLQKRSRIVKGLALARSKKDERGWTDALALVQAGGLSFGEMDQAGSRRLMWETGQTVEARMAVLTKQLDSLRSILAKTSANRVYARIYAQWRNVRLEYIGRLMEQSDNDDTWKRTNQFTADGVVQGLRDFGVAREYWQTVAERAGRAHASDAWQNDDPNRECLKIYLEYLQHREPDKVKGSAEAERVSRLLDEPDPAVRAAATKEMRKIMGDDVGPHAWGQSTTWTPQAVNYCRQMLQLADNDDERREAVDCAITTAWRADLDYAPPLVAGISPMLANVWALRDQLPTEADRLAMDGTRGLALARRGQAEAAKQIAADLKLWLGKNAGTDSQRDLVSSRIGDIEATIKDVADRLAKGERLTPITDISQPVPQSVLSDGEIGQKFAEAAVGHYSTLAVAEQDLWAAQCAIEKVVSISFSTADPRKTQAGIEQFIASLGPHESIQKSSTAEEKASLYRRWRNLRLHYLDKLMLKTDEDAIWKRLDQFTADGVSQGLEPFETAREQWQAACERAGRAHARDAGQDDTNRNCLKVYLEYLQKQGADTAVGREIFRVNRLLDDPDPAVRANATGGMRNIMGNPAQAREWSTSVPTTAQVVNACISMLKTARGEEQQREAVDCAIAAARRADLDYAPPLVLGDSAALAGVLALRDQLPTEADGKGMDGVKMMTLARRGRTQAATDTMADLRKWLDSGQGTDVQKDRVRSAISDTESLIKEVAEKTSKGERIKAITDVSLPIPPSAWSDDEMRRRFKEAAIAHYANQAVAAGDPWEARSCMETAVNASLYAMEPHSALVVADQIIARLGPDAPASKLAWAQTTRMHALYWGFQVDEAIELGQRTGEQYLHSPDPVAAEAGADALCHAYAYTAQYLGDPVGAQKYLDTIRQAYPDGRYNWLINLFTGLVERYAGPQVRGT